MPITPDTKDWTFVLREPCPQCGVDVRGFAREDVGDLIRRNVKEWKPLLAHPAVRQRPTDDVWSALEYACHVRDVFALYRTRLQMMLDEDDPSYPNWDQDAAALEQNYGEQDPAIVATALAVNGNELADAFDLVHGSQWERTGTRSDGARFTVESFARYFIHDPMHHVWDVRRGYERIEGSKDL